jgi:hypothetical protein
VNTKGFEIGSFILTDRRYLFLRNVGYKEELGSINGVRLEYEYLVGLITMGSPGVSTGSIHLMRITT